MAYEEKGAGRVLVVPQTSAEIGGMEAIRIWLNGDKDYTSGCRLYAQFGNDKLLLRLFSEKPETDFKKKRLKEALASLLSAQPAAISPKHNPKNTAAKASAKPQAVIAPVNAAPQTKPFTGTTGWSKVMDDVEASLYEQWKPLYVEMMQLSAQLRDIALEGRTDPYKKIRAGEMALRILDLDDKCEAFYEKRDYYLEHKSLPVEFPYGEPCIDANLWPLKLANHERYAREQRKKLQKDTADTTAAELVQKHEWFILYYKKMLKKDAV